MSKPRSDLAEMRAFHAKMMAVAGGSTDERLERVFELVPREAFLGPGPWRIMVNRLSVETPSADPIFVLQNVLVALDAAKGINNGEPFLHAAWIAAAAPSSGETITHIGAGTGYYTALLSMLVLPNGHVHAFEVDENLARRAAENLVPYEGVSLIHGDATEMLLPESDLIYVNAGVVSPPLSWLSALRPGGRIIFPWSPSDKLGIALLMTRRDAGFAVRPLMPSYFIPCIGASDPEACSMAPTPPQARSIRAAWLTAERVPDATAVAICRGVWFSGAGSDKDIRLS